ncbi:MAG: hypothetical protein QOJ26_1697 [Thermoplasmata archaeon]|jgi:hypothetical protein|nr:hypothetical protein [Thermoplasmata archaeon]
MIMPEKAEPTPPQPRKGMTPEERAIFEKSFKRHEEALRRLAKL